jgi:hypothetical protein
MDELQPQQNEQGNQHQMMEQFIQRAEQAAQQTQLVAQQISEQLQQTQQMFQQAMQIVQDTSNNKNSHSFHASNAQKPMNKLVTTNISNLWQAYITNSLYVGFNTHALQVIEDKNIRNLYELGKQLAQDNLKHLEGIFHQMDFPVPLGFTDADVNLKAPRLFTDHFLLYFFHVMTSNGMIGYGLSMSTSVGKQVREYNKNGLMQSVELYEKSIELLQSLKIFDNFPQTSIPATPEFVHEQSFIINFMKDQKRTLDILEITSIFAHLKTTIMHKALAIAFSQVANLKEVREVMKENVETTEKNIKNFTSMLHNDFLTTPRMWDTDITDSNVPPYSDRLMLTLIAALISIAISNYGSGMAVSTRMDLAPVYASAIARKGKLGIDVAKVLIKSGWLQQPPLATDRNVLADS